MITCGRINTHLGDDTVVSKSRVGLDRDALFDDCDALPGRPDPEGLAGEGADYNRESDEPHCTSRLALDIKKSVCRKNPTGVVFEREHDEGELEGT